MSLTRALCFRRTIALRGYLCCARHSSEFRSPISRSLRSRKGPRGFSARRTQRREALGRRTRPRTANPTGADSSRAFTSANAGSSVDRKRIHQARRRRRVRRHRTPSAHAQRFFGVIDEGHNRVLDIDSLERSVARLFAESSEQSNCVTVMTIHRAKGLEFDHVLVPGLHRVGRMDDPPTILWRPEGDQLAARSTRQRRTRCVIDG